MVCTPRLVGMIGFLFGLMFSISACMDNTLGQDPTLADDDDDLPNHLDGDQDGPKSDGTNHEVSALHQTAPWAIAVVGTDYFSTSISILDRTTQALFRENVIHSGSSSSGLSVALSGDVVFPRTHNERNWIVLLDRYPNSVLTFVDPSEFTVIGQLAVGTGFASNPHDFLWLSDNKAYVTRYERNPIPGEEAHDGGDDILIVDPLSQTITGSIPLSGYADTESNADLQARPNLMAYAKKLVWVSLDHLSGNFNQAGEGRLLGIDHENDRVDHVVQIPDLVNCGGLVTALTREALYVSCSGLFINGRDQQLTRSGLVEVDLSDDTPQVTVIRHATEGQRPYGFDLDVLQGRWLLAVRFGDLDEGLPDRLVAVDLENQEEIVVHEAGTAYGMGGLLVDDDTDIVYVGEADPVTPGVHLYHLTDEDSFEYEGFVNAHPNVGLPPRHIRFY